MGKRIGSIDLFRGLCIFIMFLSHLGIWWISSEEYQVFFMYVWQPIGRPIAKGSGFILISGVSVALSYSKNIVDDHNFFEEKKRIWRNKSYIRAIVLFIIAILVNLLIMSFDPNAKIYDWWILVTLSICLFCTWELMKLSIKSRIVFGIGWIGLNHFINMLFYNYRNLSIFSDFLMEFFYPIDPGQNSILVFFPFFIFGTVLGSILSNIDFDRTDNMREFFKSFTLPLILASFSAIILGVTFQFPNYIIANTTSFVIFALGLDSLILCLLITLEKKTQINFNPKSSPFYYYSYYSLTLFAFHYIFFPFSFIWALDFITFWYVLFIALVPFTLFLVSMYKKVAGLFSIKYVVTVVSEFIAMKIDEISFQSEEPKAFKNLISKLKINLANKI
ncbi:MAG: DUF1624 domain-containing protein [Candidatus Lokiarchaeota archaeon]|nr:DUF1624 domain-containing protein [Candidatus Lokiarchaeota archaeon]